MSKYKVERTGDNLENWGKIESALQEFAELLKVNISVDNPHGKNSSIKTEPGMLFIRFWSLPEGASFNSTKIEEAFGRSTDSGQHDGVKPSGQGIPIIDPISVQTVTLAEVHDGTIFVLFDLPHGGHNSEFMAGIMQQYVALQDPEKKAVIMAEKATEIAKAREAWLNECQKRFEKILTGTKKEIERADNAIKDYQRKLVEQIRILDGQRKKLAQLKLSQPEASERYLKEFEKLHEVPHVVKVKVESGKINIFTDRIYVEYDGKTYNIGDFRIEIFTDGGNGGVRMYNLTNKQDSYDHPHVDSSSPCLGNIKEAIPQLLGDYEYSIIVILCVQYLHSYNSGDPYRKIENWPVVESK